MCIGKHAFASNTLTSITIPDGVTSIGEGAFEQNQLTSVIIEGEKGRFNDDWRSIGYAYEYMPGIINENGLLFYDGEIKKYIGSSKDITIPSKIHGETVKSIGNRVFFCANLVNVVIPSTVSQIRPQAFWGNALTHIDIPNSVTTIGEYAFAHNNLERVVIPSNVKVIKLTAFINNNLKHLTINYNKANPKDRFDHLIGTATFSNIAADKVVYVNEE